MSKLHFKTGLITFVGIIMSLIFADINVGWLNAYNVMAITFFVSGCVSIIWPSDALVELRDGKFYVSRGTYTLTNFILCAIMIFTYMIDHPQIDANGVPHYMLPERLIVIILGKLAIIQRLFTGAGNAQLNR